MNPQDHQIKAHFTNKTPNGIEGVSLQIAVQKYMKLTLQPISNPRLEGNSQRQVTQDLSIVNSEEGKKPLAIKIRVQYTANGQQIVEQKVINSIA